MTTLAAGLFIAALGILIRYRGATSLIAGFDLEKISDEEGLSNFIGLNAVYVASLTIVIGLIEYSQFQSKIYWYIYTAAVVLLILRMIVGARDYN
ncbi:DUF3784 domain-containing protein [Candidatus Nanohalobium constans]|nr:DUF3784 domain-containing protein [Candidatus Nanohalobium constans]